MTHEHVRVLCPRITFPEKTWKKLLAYVEACPMEVGGLGTVERVGQLLVVKDVFLLEQEVSPVSTVLDQRAVVKFLTDWTVAGNDPSLLRFWWHSHADMNVFWSETDMATIRQFTQGNWLLSLVGNRKRETRVRLTSSEPFPFAIDCLPVEVIPDVDDAIAKAAREEIAAKVRRKRRFLPFGKDKASPPAPDDPLMALNDGPEEE